MLNYEKSSLIECVDQNLPGGRRQIVENTETSAWMIRTKTSAVNVGQPSHSLKPKCAKDFRRMLLVFRLTTFT